MRVPLIEVTVDQHGVYESRPDTPWEDIRVPIATVNGGADAVVFAPGEGEFFYCNLTREGDDPASLPAHLGESVARHVAGCGVDVVAVAERGGRAETCSQFASRVVSDYAGITSLIGEVSEFAVRGDFARGTPNPMVIYVDEYTALYPREFHGQFGRWFSGDESGARSYFNRTSNKVVTAAKRYPPGEVGVCLIAASATPLRAGDVFASYAPWPHSVAKVEVSNQVDSALADDPGALYVTTAEPNDHGGHMVWAWTRFDLAL